MKRTTLAVAATLLLAACSQTPEEAAPDLSPQFGTSTYDSVEQLAVGGSGVYLGGAWSDKPSLIKFGRAGNIPWVRSVTGPVVEVALDSSANAYVVFYSSTNDAQYFVRKYTSSGTFVWQRQLTNPSGTEFHSYASDVDTQNNIYLSFAAEGKAELRKYRSDGTLLYRRAIAETVSDLSVAPDGTAYTVSNQYLTRYTSQGQQVWRKTLALVANKVAVGGSQVYVAGYDEFDEYTEPSVQLARYNSSGSKSWQRTVQQGLFSSLQGLDADTQGNVFVGIERREEPRGDQDVYFYSYNAAGMQLAQRMFDLGYDNSLAEIRALSATEVYLGGTTYSESTELDGFLVRLNGLTGGVTWQR